MSAVGTVDRAVQDLVGDDAEALIKEARRRARRRRLRGGFGLVLLAGAAVLAYVASAGGGGGIVTETVSRPFANLRAFSGKGELAFISRGRLWVLDGARRTLRALPVGALSAPASPALSSDGRWLAYLAVRQTFDGPVSSLWLARGDGGGAREVRDVDGGRLVGWSPTADVLAIIVDRADRQTGTTLELVSPGRSPRRLLMLSRSAQRVGEIRSAVWSPDGREIAVSTDDFARRGRTLVRVYPLHGGAAVTWFSISNQQGLAGVCTGCGGAKDVIADLAGWWPRWGIALWVYCCGADHNNDGSPLALLAYPGAAPQILARTLSDQVTNALAAGAHGALAVVASSGGREIGIGKTVERCDPRTRTCASLAGATTWSGPHAQPCPCAGLVPAPGRPGSGVSLDPAWSPGGDQLAYVKAPTAVTPGWPSLAWYHDQALFVWNARTGVSRRLAVPHGAAAPAWSRDGRELLYVGDDALWLLPADGGRAVVIARPLFPAAQWKGVANDPLSYYGQIDWSGQFSWWSP
jgi:hypothetical protein